MIGAVRSKSIADLNPPHRRRARENAALAARAAARTPQLCHIPDKDASMLRDAATGTRSGVPAFATQEHAALGAERGIEMIWTLVVVALLIVAEFAHLELKEWNARRRAIKRGRTLTAKYGIPWR
jgi:hypothetical protein